MDTLAATALSFIQKLPGLPYGLTRRDASFGLVSWSRLRSVDIASDYSVVKVQTTEATARRASPWNLRY